MQRFRFKYRLLSLVLAGAALGVALAQTESEIESDEVKRVGTHIACQCGSCTENVNCMMSAGQCHFCKPARTKIYSMQRAGMSDSQIIGAFIQEYGQKIFRGDPNNFFWLVPYLSLAAGGVVVWLILRRVRSHQTLKPAVAGPAPGGDAELARYRDAIERDLSKLE
jgi:cytochrome c-type biogenesis protein CcmH/NrfF